MDYTIPTQVLYESAKRELHELMQKAKGEYGLPAYLLEGLLSNELAELRNQKCDEIAQGYSNIIKQIEDYNSAANVQQAEEQQAEEQQ